MHIFLNDSEAVISYLISEGRSSITITVYRKCFSQLGEYLASNNIEYTPEKAEQWVKLQEGKQNKRDYSLYVAAVRKLGMIYQTGIVQFDRYNPEKMTSSVLCIDFKEILEKYINNCNVTSNTKMAKRYKCIFILRFFQDNGCTHVSDITYKHLLGYCAYLENKPLQVRSQYHSTLNSLLNYLYANGKQVPYGYTLFTKGYAIRKLHFWEIETVETIDSWKALHAYATSSATLDHYIQIAESVYQLHEKHKYSSSYLQVIRMAIILFYLFMDWHELRYLPEISLLWANKIIPYVSESEGNTIRRTLIIIGQTYKGEKVDIRTVFRRRTAQQDLPDWCVLPIMAFLEIKTKEGKERSTILMLRACCIRFCKFLVSIGISSFYDVTAEHIKQFSRVDKHKTPKGKNAYNSRIRDFLQFLEDRRYLSSPFLYLALPRISASQEHFVIVLTEEEQSTIRSLLQEEGDLISLRQKAMLQLGLYMGLRAIDVVNLSIDDINWEDVSIQFVQEKTGCELYLPMPTEVANAIYHYIINERPESSNHKVFLSSKAPYLELKSSAVCRKALNAALPDRDVEGSGFHVLRKTFATNLLGNGVGMQDVAEMLGHHGLANVKKYISLNEQQMRLCALDLSGQGISLERRFIDE